MGCVFAAVVQAARVNLTGVNEVPHAVDQCLFVFGQVGLGNRSGGKVVAVKNEILDAMTQRRPNQLLQVLELKLFA